MPTAAINNCSKFGALSDPGFSTSATMLNPHHPALEA
jgi:hypothetical protein